jgi:co-chaperonin GroES (HSP10)
MTTAFGNFCLQRKGSHIIQPRGLFVVLDLIAKAERKQGSITVPTHNDKFCEAIVMAVGPGNSMAGGARPETFDLKVGQRVLVTHKMPGREELTGQQVLKPTGLPYVDGEKTYTLIEERYILGILDQPEPAISEAPAKFGNNGLVIN